VLWPSCDNYRSHLPRDAKEKPPRHRAAFLCFPFATNSLAHFSSVRHSHCGPLGLGFRHTYRSWLDAVGTPIAVQQKLMRHADIRTTMNTYGDVVTDELEQASAKIVGLALKTDSNVISAAVSHCKNGSSGRTRIRTIT